MKNKGKGGEGAFSSTPDLYAASKALLQGSAEHPDDSSCRSYTSDSAYSFARMFRRHRGHGTSYDSLPIYGTVVFAHFTKEMGSWEEYYE
jgi:hypothetical protein